MLVAVAASIGNLFNLVAVQSERLNRYPQVVGVFTEGEFDAWLLAVQRRIEQRLAGDDSEPLVAPG